MGTVLVIGLGDLGQRVFHALTLQSGIERLVIAGRNADVARESGAQGRLTAHLCGGPGYVGEAVLDLGEREGAVRAVRDVQPDVIVMAASRHTWWRMPVQDERRTELLRSLPYAFWTPFNVPLVRAAVQCRDEAGVRAPIVSLPYPDVIGSILRPAGDAPDLGAGNVTEIAAKLGVLVRERYGEQPVIRLVAHHAVERVAFGAFMLPVATSELQPEPPWYARVEVGDRVLPASESDQLLRSPYPLQSMAAIHRLTAAATVQTVKALLLDEPVSTHAPAPYGLPGGYPVRLGSGCIALDLPDDQSEADAIAINERAARWDGIERIDSDGTLRFTPEVSEAGERVLGLDVRSLRPDEHEDVAEEILARIERM